MAGRVKRRVLSRGPVDALLSRCPPDWGRLEVGDTELESIGIQPGDAHLGGAVSGVLGQPRLMYGQEQVVRGLTSLRFAPEESRMPREGECNADHWIITQVAHSSGTEYCLHGPYKSQIDMEKNAGIRHWPTYEQFSAFVSTLPMPDVDDSED